MKLSKPQGYKELEDVTDGFKGEIGRGPFGMVYKGRIKGELNQISKEADKEFTTEMIGQTHHKNLVGFIGFYKEEDQQLLVYEYMSNGIVADYLFSNMRPSWTERI
ncbi:G-type lectin S-receptor-like serine/threonine-protein kinase LECRK4 [Bienertia sinuspersici]